MGKFSLEQKIKDRLEGHEVHIDKSELWKGIGIEEEKDRKAIWFWWLGGFIGIVLITGLVWFIDKEGNDAAPKTQSTSLIAVDQSLSKTGNETIKEVSTTKHLSDIIEEVKSENELEKTEKEKNVVEAGNSNSTKNNFENLTRESKFKSNSKSGIVDEVVSSEKDESSLVESTPSIIDEITNKKSPKETSEKITSIESITGVSTTLVFEREFEKLDKEVNPFIKPVVNPRKIEFELFGGLGSISRDLNTTDGDIEGYLYVRDTSEASLEHASFGFSVKYNLGRGFYSKVGMTVNRWNEKMNYRNISDPDTTIAEVPDVILIDLAGNETVTYTEGEVVSYNVTNWTRYNRLTQIDLPISLGYEYNIHRWSVFGEASAIFNLNQKFSGYLYSQDLEIVQNPSIFKSKIGMNLGLNLGLGYGITERLRGRLSARYYRSLNSVLLPETEVEQKYTSLGLRVSMGFLF